MLFVDFAFANDNNKPNIRWWRMRERLCRTIFAINNQQQEMTRYGEYKWHICVCGDRTPRLVLRTLFHFKLSIIYLCPISKGPKLIIAVDFSCIFANFECCRQYPNIMNRRVFSQNFTSSHHPPPLLSPSHSQSSTKQLFPVSLHLPGQGVFVYIGNKEAPSE